MNDFFKRLSWRLTGGIVTIALGAFAAAQAQRQGAIDDQPLPALESPAWADALPIPIQAGPEQRLAGGDLSSHDAQSYPSPTTFVAQVNHEEPANDPVEDGPGMGFSGMAMPGLAMPMPGEAPAPVADEGASSMAMPVMGMPQPSSETPASSGSVAETSTATQAVSDAPAMAMPGFQPQAIADLQEIPASGPSSMAGPSPMAEVQFDRGPDVSLQPSFDSPVAFQQTGPSQPGVQDQEATLVQSGPRSIEPAVAQPEMAQPDMNQPQMAMPPTMEAPMDTPMPQGSDDYAAADPALINSLRNEGPSSFASPQDYGNATLPGYNVATDRDRSLPVLPDPSAYPSQSNRDPAYATESRYESEPSYENVQAYAEEPQYPAGGGYGQNANPPARLAGHQATGQPGMGLPARAMGNAPAGNSTGRSNGYLENPNYRGSNGDAISISMPGDRRLEGVQSPSVVIHKRAPAEVKVGQPATFVIQVRNVGSAEALGVQVHDRIPTGMELTEASPNPVVQGDHLLWDLGAMPVGDERSITMQLVPREEGELGSVARVTFEAAASVRTRSTRPELKIVQRAPPKVLKGQQLEIELEISNIGTGEATGVILQEDVPEGLDHPRGRKLDNALGSLRPGETRREVLRLRAMDPGMIRNVVHLLAEDAQDVSHAVDVQVVAPALGVQLAGPSRRYLERQATYMVNIQNTGSAPATNVEVIAYLDRGFTFVSTENNGHYDSNRHAVLWSIVNLPPGDAGSVPLTLLPVEEGEQAIRLEAVADLDTRAQSESTVSVQSQAELTFSIADTADPIELGSETTYEIRVQNSGSRSDSNVQVRLVVPPGIELRESDTAMETDGRGGAMFAPHKSLAAGGELVYRVRVRGVQPDTHIIKAIVTSDQSRVPVTKEESTMVYQDR